METFKSIIIGGGPAGLIAAETLANSGAEVVVYERKASLGRKFLMAGRGGLNLTHSEDLDRFQSRYSEASSFMSPLLRQFSPNDLINWCEGLGEPTFKGSSGRIFPKNFKASPLLRAWIKRLENLGVQFRMNKTWQGWDGEKHLIFRNPDNSIEKATADTTLLALGGASWPNLGSDGSWVRNLEERNVPIAPFKPSNCGFYVEWSKIFQDKFSGHPLKNISVSFENEITPGEIMISKHGIEGGVIYALSASIRKSLEEKKTTIIYLDLRPSMTLAAIIHKLGQPRNSQSFSSYLQRVLNLDSLSLNLLRECDMKVAEYSPEKLALLIKRLPMHLKAYFPIDRAISSAGGLSLNAVDQNLMINSMPGVFVAGEMLDWEAPTGGYLLQASFATGVAAARGMIRYASKS